MRHLRPGIFVAAGAVELREPAAISALIAASTAAGEGFRAPLLRAAAAGELAIAAAVAGTPIPARILKQRHPTVLLLTDDCPSATGPVAWPQARKLVRWAARIVLHGTGGQPEHYSLIAAAAVRVGQVLVVECQQRHLSAWQQVVLLERKSRSLLCIMPPPGGQHPISPAEAGEAVH